MQKLSMREDECQDQQGTAASSTLSFEPGTWNQLERQLLCPVAHPCAINSKQSKHTSCQPQSEKEREKERETGT